MDDSIFEDAGLKIEDSSETLSRISNECIENGITQCVSNGNDDKQHKIFYDISAADRDDAVKEFIVPAGYKNSTFNVERIKDNLRNQYKRDKTVKVYKFDDYEQVCNGILSAIRMKKLPSRSYLIGAPNGFGKSSFVYESLITLKHHGFRTVPYISLWELAQLRVENEHRIMNPYKRFKEENSNYYYTEPNEHVGYIKEPQVVTGMYSYSEYINADCLFVSFTDVISKDIESHTLYQLLSIRGAKGLPTIVLMSTSLDPYINDIKLRELVWDEILTYYENDRCYDRLYHVSCYKKRNMSKLDNKGATVDSDTGIVH